MRGPAVRRVLERLEDVRPKGGGWVAVCPCHDDHTPSLRITEGDDGSALLTCDPCGANGAAVCEAVGLEPAALFADYRDNGQRGPSREWKVRDPDGNVVATHKRFNKPGGGKAVVWYRGGSSGLDGLPLEELPLYGCHQLGEREPGDDRPVFVTEGEKACDYLLDLGLPAVGTVGGWQVPPCAESLSILRGRDVVLWPDNDDNGRTHMQRIAERLDGVAARVRVFAPELPPKGDAEEWVQAAGDDPAAELLAAVEEHAADPETLSCQPVERVRQERKGIPWKTAADEASAEPTEWVARPYIPGGAVVLLEGPPKVAGKTTYSLHLCGAVIDGGPFMGQPTLRGPVVYLTEETVGTFAQGLDRAGLIGCEDLHYITRHDVAGTGWPDVVAAAVAKAEEVGARLLVVDTLPVFAGVAGEEENATGHALEGMKPLQDAAAGGLAVVAVRHERKSGGAVGTAGRGSSAWTGAADVVLALRRPQGGTRPGVRELHALSRYDDTPDLLMVELTDAGYVPKGTSAAVAHEEARKAIQGAAPRDEGSAARLDALLDAVDVDVSRATLRRAVDDLQEDGVLERIGEGVRGDPYRFFLVTHTYGCLDEKEKWGSA